MTVVLFPDATAVVASLLTAAFIERAEDIPLVDVEPNPRPERFVLVDRTGGVSRSVVIDDPQVTVDSWGTSREDAHDIAQLCRGLIHAATGSTVDGVAIYRIGEAAGPANLPDPVSDHPRYRQTFLVAMRGTAEDLGS